MIDPPVAGSGSRLAFMAPLSDARAARLVAMLAASAPQTVLDLGCGWGELLIRVVAAVPGARGVGIDTHGPDLERGRAAVAARGLSDRVTFHEAPAPDVAVDAAEVVISIGAYQAFGSVAEGLLALRERVVSGGRLLFGAEYWEQPPTADRLASMWPGITADDCLDLPALVDAAVAAKFRPLRIESATRGEWEEFESGLAQEREEWLVDNSEHPLAAEVREQLDASRNIWLRGHRDVMGFAYLTLGAAER